MHRYDERSAGDCNHRKVTDEIETQLVVKGGIDRRGCVSPEQRIAISWHTDNGLRGDVGGGSGPVLNDKRLTEPRGERLTHQPHENVRPAAGGIPNYAAHRPRRVDLRPRDV